MPNADANADDVDARYADTLTHDELARLVVKRDAPAVVHFVVHYALFVASAAVAVRADNEIVRVAAAIVCAPLWSGLFATMHETMHLTAFRTRALNEIALWLSALPIFFVPTAATVFPSPADQAVSHHAVRFASMAFSVMRSRRATATRATLCDLPRAHSDS